MHSVGYKIVIVTVFAAIMAMVIWLVAHFAAPGVADPAGAGAFAGVELGGFLLIYHGMLRTSEELQLDQEDDGDDDA